MILSFVACLAALFCLIAGLRASRLSLGLPVAYLISLELIHVPGAVVHMLVPEFFSNSAIIETGFGFAGIGCVCFALGVWGSRYLQRDHGPLPSAESSMDTTGSRSDFWLYCLFGGWLVVYGLTPLRSIPSFGAVVDEAGAIWMLGVMLGLRSALQRSDLRAAMRWGFALMVYPALMLVLAGFLSYGSAAIIIVTSILTISVRSPWRLSLGMVAACFLGLTIFVNYFEHRDDIRDAVWGNASLSDRLDALSAATDNAHWLDLSDPDDAMAFDARLNQNLFVGLAAERIRRGEVDYLYGQSIWEGLEALVPRLIWQDKPVFGGSPKIVSEMTGIEVAPDTSFGVGNVMEFQINFGTYGVVVGFLVLGFLIGWLDRKAAAAERSGDLGTVILCFLPAVALIQPNGSVVELASGSAAALIAGVGWKWLWTLLADRRRLAEAPGEFTSKRLRP